MNGGSVQGGWEPPLTPVPPGGGNPTLTPRPATSPKEQEEGEQRCTMGTMCSASRGTHGARSPTSLSSQQGASNVCPLPGQDFNLFSQEKGVGIMLGGCWSQAQAHKASHEAWQEAKATRDPVPGHGHPCTCVFSLLPWDINGAERTFQAQHHAEKVPISPPGSQSLHVPAKVFCSPR